MGLIHTRARKKRDRAEAKLLREQARAVRHDAGAADCRAVTDREREAEGLPWYAQPTVRAMLRALSRGKPGR